MEHTKTPWDCDYEYTPAHIAGGEIIDMEPTGMYEVFANGGEDIVCIANKDNANRIVACVNACEGIETENLEGAELRKVCEDRLWQIAENERLQAQNARFLGALKELVDGTDPEFAILYGFSEQHSAARAAIAEAEKTTHQ